MRGAAVSISSLFGNTNAVDRHEAATAGGSILPEELQVVIAHPEGAGALRLASLFRGLGVEVFLGGAMARLQEDALVVIDPNGCRGTLAERIAAARRRFPRHRLCIAPDPGALPARPVPPPFWEAEDALAYLRAGGVPLLAIEECEAPTDDAPSRPARGHQNALSSRH